MNNSDIIEYDKKYKNFEHTLDVGGIMIALVDDRVAGFQSFVIVGDIS